MAEEYLVLTAVGTDRPGLVAELTALLAEQGANIADSRMALLGGEFALVMLVTGTAEQLTAVSRDVVAVADRLGLQLIAKPTRSAAARRTGLLRSYTVNVHALDHPGIVHAVTEALRRLHG